MQNSSSREISNINTEKWLLSTGGFKFPEMQGVEWMMIPDTPYTVDMSRYFTNISDELDKWLIATSDNKMDWNEVYDESVSLDQLMASVSITMKPTEGADWLVVQNARNNPMVRYMKRIAEAGNCDECGNRSDCTSKRSALDLY